MKYLKTHEKYIHNEQDRIDDIKFINEFSKKFEYLFEYRLNLDVSSKMEFRDYIGYGASKNYTGETILNNKNISSKKVKIKYSIFLDTDINPNGITNENDIGRTFTIKFEILKNKSTNINNLKHFYNYSKNMDDVLEKFDDYVFYTLRIRKPTKEELEQYRLEKAAKKYNL